MLEKVKKFFMHIRPTTQKENKRSSFQMLSFSVFFVFQTAEIILFDFPKIIKIYSALFMMLTFSGEIPVVS